MDKLIAMERPAGGHVEASPRVLDPCSGGRMMWFDRSHPDVVFGDKRCETVTVTDRSHGRADGTRTLTVVVPAGPANSSTRTVGGSIVLPSTVTVVVATVVETVGSSREGTTSNSQIVPAATIAAIMSAIAAVRCLRHQLMAHPPWGTRS